MRGGVELGARLTTPSSSTSVVADHIGGDRVVIAARGALAEPSASLAWEADAIRGARARSGTIDLEAAARPSITRPSRRRSAPRAARPSARSRPARSRAPRGAGDRRRRAVSALRGERIDRILGAWSAGLDGLLLGNAIPGAALPIGRAAIEAEIAARPGPFTLVASAGARAEVAGDAPSSPIAPSRDATVGARIELDLPLRRDFARGVGEAPWQHRVAPSLAVAASASAQRGAFFTPLSLTAPPGLGLAAAGITTSFGRAAGPSLRLEARGGWRSARPAPLRSSPVGSPRRRCSSAPRSRSPPCPRRARPGRR